MRSGSDLGRWSYAKENAGHDGVHEYQEPLGQFQQSLRPPPQSDSLLLTTQRYVHECRRIYPSMVTTGQRLLPLQIRAKDKLATPTKVMDTEATRFSSPRGQLDHASAPISMENKITTRILAKASPLVESSSASVSSERPRESPARPPTRSGKHPRTEAPNSADEPIVIDGNDFTPGESFVISSRTIPSCDPVSCPPRKIEQTGRKGGESNNSHGNGNRNDGVGFDDSIEGLESSSSRGPRGAGAKGDDRMDTDESVLARLTEFIDMARQTAIQNEELSRELGEQKRRATSTNRRLEQCKSTCAELRESLSLAQDTVIKLREHELKWAEGTASEMSLRGELCTLRDEHASATAEASVLKKRCEALQQENKELGDRLATTAAEKRQVEARARKLLRSDRYRGF